ncbi:hypothetical protein OHJ28_15595 [Dickeya fangzhongdai]|uniref:hypothetical protein n=1 Tax=Dickeya fangzhongdai TaxID=1778540 RepID=UPI0033077F1B
MLKPPILSILVLLFTVCFFYGKAIGSDSENYLIGDFKKNKNLLEIGSVCIVKKKTIDTNIINEKYSLSETDRCIAECSYLLDIPGDYGSTNFHSCMAKCKGEIPLCDI